MSDYAAYRARRTFGSLDGFRCVSILAVIWHHSRGDLQLGRIGNRGFLGVDMVFVLSYGMYLLHVFVVHFTDRLGEHGLPSLLLFPLAVLGTVAVAELSYRFYETPFLRLKKRFTR